jgi:hypothetical protein
MTPASLVFAAALVAWGSVSAPVATPTSDAVGPVPAAPVVVPPPPSAPPPIVVNQLFDEPRLVARPSRPRTSRPGRPVLYRDWRFWTISGGLFVATVVVTFLVTRPGPQPYAGNLPPNVVVFP